MRRTLLVVTALHFLPAICCTSSALGFEARLLKESSGPALVGAPCPLVTSTDGTAANYRWYNLCSGYVWIYSCCVTNEGMGVLFGGPEQSEVNETNVVKRAITYWRNVVMGYAQTVDIYVDEDEQGDGCPDAGWLQDLNLDPGLRWNCSSFDQPIRGGVEYLIVRFQHDGGAAPSVATDGPYSEACDPDSPARSFYYGINASACVPWTFATGDPDNFLHWLILDRGPSNATRQDSWGAIKTLFR
jgi:hypothetical protein